MNSPLSPNSNTRLVRSIAVQDIISGYHNNFQIDTESFFRGLDEIEIHECLDTGYRFYFPFNIAGDSQFYELLQKFEWYYMPWKWEHQQAMEFIDKDDVILEIGSGGLGFVERLHLNGYQIHGLELNQNSIKRSREKELSVFGEYIEDYAERSEGRYDVVCSFQVLEHISDVHSFIAASVRCLKKGGRLIISVPNNDSMVNARPYLLNMPPHHMGLWNVKSLSSLEKIFNLKIESVKYEPIQDYHFKMYREGFEYLYVKSRVINSIYYRMGLGRYVLNYARKNARKINGHTFQMIFIKS